MDNWQPIETAERDEQKPILVFYDHAADPYRDPVNPDRLTDYAAIAESGDFLTGKGVIVAVWRDGYHENEGLESGITYWVPGGWFPFVNGDAQDEVCNATHWMPLPTPPKDHHHE